MPVKTFSLATVLTVTTGRLLCPMDEAYQVLNYLTGDRVYTHQIPRVMDACAAYLLQQIPALAAVDVAGLDTFLQDTPGLPGIARWLAILDLPATVALAPMPPGTSASCDPVEELSEMIGPERVIVVTNEETPPCTPPS